MIFLTPVAVPSIVSSARQEFSKKAFAEKQQIIAQEEKRYSDSVHTRRTATADRAVDGEGRKFEEVQFIITERFKLDGIRYVSDGVFALDFDTHMDLVRAMVL